MKKTIIMALLLAFLLPAAALSETVDVITIDGVIDPAVSDFVKSSIETAQKDGSKALIIELNTPGGMLDSTREIVQLFLDSDLPVVIYVSPAGAQAASAGMIISIAGHLAVMAPGTNIGAAHPVIFGSEGYQPLPKDDIMMEKATNDTVAWVRSICDVRKRNADVAEKAVSESKSLSARDAVDKKLVDGMADDLNDLLTNFLPKRTVTIKDGSTVSFAGMELTPRRIEMTVPQRLHHLINNPTFIYVLMLIGMLGIAIEFKSPGLVFPALIGVSCILFALIAPSLPINYIGLILIIIGFALLIAEVFITSFGLLTVAGITALIFGSLMLFKAPEVPDMDPFMIPHVTPPLYLIFSTVIFVASVILLFGAAIVRTHRQKVMTGYEEMVGVEAVAATDIGPEGGKIFVHSEWWNAFSDTPIAKGDRIVIKSVDKLNCRVEKAGGGVSPSAPPASSEVHDPPAKA